MTFSETRLPKDGPATYQIRVQGVIDAGWSDSLGGMGIVTDFQINQSPITILTGRLADQAALAGILNALHDLGFTLLTVELLSSE